MWPTSRACATRRPSPSKALDPTVLARELDSHVRPAGDPRWFLRLTRVAYDGCGEAAAACDVETNTGFKIFCLKVVYFTQKETVF
jgi:hypothetical protein